MSGPLPRLAPLGDAALLLTFGTSADQQTLARVRAAASAIAEAAPIGVIDVVPGYATLAVHFDPLATNGADLRDRLAVTLNTPAAAVGNDRAPLVEIPVRYDGADLSEVAERTGLAEAEVIRRHRDREYRVAFLGFVPGFAYLGPLDPALVLPRRASPRVSVPAGAVAIAGEQTGVYPAATPGGWHLIGRTSVRMFDPARDRPALLAVGDRVRFVEEKR